MAAAFSRHDISMLDPLLPLVLLQSRFYRSVVALGSTAFVFRVLYPATRVSDRGKAITLLRGDDG